jgi:RNA processing factor Prp31
MKSLTIILSALLFANVSFANYTALVTEVRTAVETAKVNSAVLERAAAVGASAAILPDVAPVLSKLVTQIKQVAADNSKELNGIAKAKRLEALQLAFVATTLNSGKEKSAEVTKILNGNFSAMLTAPVNATEQLSKDQLAKIVNFFDLFTKNVSEKRMSIQEAAQSASQEATGGDVSAFASNCGSQQRK